jgi:hypothetical protein
MPFMYGAYMHPGMMPPFMYDPENARTMMQYFTDPSVAAQGAAAFGARTGHIGEAGKFGSQEAQPAAAGQSGSQVQFQGMPSMPFSQMYMPQYYPYGAQSGQVQGYGPYGRFPMYKPPGMFQGSGSAPGAAPSGTFSDESNDYSSKAAVSAFPQGPFYDSQPAPAPKSAAPGSKAHAPGESAFKQSSGFSSQRSDAGAFPPYFGVNSPFAAAHMMGQQPTYSPPGRGSTQQ